MGCTWEGARVGPPAAPCKEFGRDVFPIDIPTMGVLYKYCTGRGLEKAGDELTCPTGAPGVG